MRMTVISRLYLYLIESLIFPARTSLISIIKIISAMTGSYLLGNGVFHALNKYSQKSNDIGTKRFEDLEKIDIEFEEYIESDEFDLKSKNMENKYINLKNGQAKLNVLPNPKKQLFPAHTLIMEWKDMDRHSGPGLVNLWNTCFMNSVLQILSYTPPLWNFLITESKINNNVKDSCDEKNISILEVSNHDFFCSKCALAKLFKEMNKNNQSVSPTEISHNITAIHKDLRIGRQEDAHEFLLSLLNNMRKHYKIPKKLDKYTEHTQFIDHIFGGWIRNTVICSMCSHESISYDPLLILHLDIEKCKTLSSALSQFFSEQEIIGGGYDCDGCQKSTPAKIRTDLEQAPNFLIIQLKRFHQSHGYITKNKNFVSYEAQLDLSNFNKNYKEMKYLLYGVIVHVGGGCGSGHYYAYAESSPGQWLQLNDTSVQAVGLHRVLNEDAYLLFYRKLYSEINYNKKPKIESKNTINCDDSKIIAVNLINHYQKEFNQNISQNAINTSNKASWDSRNSVKIKYSSHNTPNITIEDNKDSFQNISKKNKKRHKKHLSTSSLYKSNQFQSTYDRKYSSSYSHPFNHSNYQDF